MLNQTLETDMPTGTAESVGDGSTFAATIAEGLHALAQPLTILRSTVALLATPETPEAGRRRYLDLSAEQVQRACDLFECLQDLVIANQAEAIRAPFAISKLIAAATDDPTIGLDGSNVRINVLATGDLPPVLGDYARTLQALAATLKIAISLSAAGDSVEVLPMPSGGFLRLAVSNVRALGRTLNSSERLSLALAEANIRSQRGRFKLAEDPFCVSMELPFAG
jgi:hypothetical protein